MAGSRCAKNLLTTALFMLNMSQKSVFSTSQSDLLPVFLEVCPLLSHPNFVGLWVRLGMLCWCIQRIYSQVNIDGGSLGLISLSNAFEHMELGEYLES